MATFIKKVILTGETAVLAMNIEIRQDQYLQIKRAENTLESSNAISELILANAATHGNVFELRDYDEDIEIEDVDLKELKEYEFKLEEMDVSLQWKDLYLSFKSGYGDETFFITEPISLSELHNFYNSEEPKGAIRENGEFVEIRYILPGLLTAKKPDGFESMSKKEKEDWAFDVLSEKTDFELVKGTYTLEDENGADRCLQDAHKVYDETPYVEAIASGCGEKLHYLTPLWNMYSEQLGKSKNAISVESFEELLEKADLITIDGSPYLHTWDFEDDYLISSKYEEDGLGYETNIDKDEVLGIFKEKEIYKIVCEDTDYKVSLHTLGSL